MLFTVFRIKNILVIVAMLFGASCYPFVDGDRAVIPPVRKAATAGNITLWLITDRGELVKVTESGDLNTPVDFPAKTDAVFFLDDRKGWVADSSGIVWSTNDGE